MPRQNFYSSRIANTTPVVQRGIAKLAEVAIALKANSAWIITPAKSNLGGFISSAIGEPAADALAKGKPVNLSETCVLRHYTEKTLPFSGDGSPILLCYAGKALLNKVEGLRNVPALIVLPWNMEDVQPFIDAHAPVDILTNKAPAASKVTNPVVEQALTSFIRAINKSTGISHPSDKSRAIETFRILQQARHADKIAEIAANPSKFRAGTGGGWREDILDQWRTSANGEEEPDA